MRFTLEIKMDNAAFQDDPMGELSQTIKEVAEILPNSSENIRRCSGKIKDVNGNTVGEWEVA
jgi:hypothetical protein